MASYCPASQLTNLARPWLKIKNAKNSTRDIAQWKALDSHPGTSDKQQKQTKNKCMYNINVYTHTHIDIYFITLRAWSPFYNKFCVVSYSTDSKDRE